MWLSNGLFTATVNLTALESVFELGRSGESGWWEVGVVERVGGGKWE